ncbi:aminoglycoside phosphotransferase family protein [Pontibacter ruber]|uniref:Aminoglycoside phosphotransferase family protein n=1 Tax=Pontibacter ruber TaxID=1343895 RepID=A0ABW5D1H6_9BACT|nr:aminoglycoside phosphotransferase family protein [Pontibacter ruber]
MRSIIKLGRYHYSKPSFIYHFGKWTFKIFTPNGKASKIAELQGNHGALGSMFWSGQVLRIKHRLFYLVMKRGEPICAENSLLAEQFIESKLQEALGYPVQPSSNAFDFKYLRNLENIGLKPGLLEKAENILRSVNLPVTSAHGDLHQGNMVHVDHQIKIIDWSMFTCNGSFITDYIHYHNYGQAIYYRESWTESILKEQPYLDKLAQELQTTSNHLRLAYSINRISGEIGQLSNLEVIPEKVIAKYNYVLKNIIDEFKEANVQRSDSIV